MANIATIHRDEMLIKTSVHYGTVEIIPTGKVMGNSMYLGGYSIYRDREGNETKRTEPTYHMRVYSE